MHTIILFLSFKFLFPDGHNIRYFVLAQMEMNYIIVLATAIIRKEPTEYIDGKMDREAIPGSQNRIKW